MTTNREDSPMAELTDQQKVRLSILTLVQNDTAAAQEAIDFIADDVLKLELFNRQYVLVQAEPTPVTRTVKAIQGVKDALPLFQ
jgi:hypothetical protein